MANEVVKILRDTGYVVFKETGKALKAKSHRKPSYSVKSAVFVHFEGGTNCDSGSSIGFPKRDKESIKAAKDWKKMYKANQPKIDGEPWVWKDNNYTRALEDYYGYRRVKAEKGELLLELGQMTCEKQFKWLKPNLKNIGWLIAHFLDSTQKKIIPKPPNLRNNFKSR